jgi:phosphoribosylamine--glycine ligase
VNILILGSGGREHALAWRLSLDPSSSRIYVWPGNDGINGCKIEIVNTPYDKEAFLEFVDTHHIKLIVPGAEKFLYEGVADWCQDLNLTCFGPSKKASLLEESKLFSKTLMMEAGVPTSVYKDISALFEQDVNLAAGVLKNFKRPVIKISGSSLGKGVFVCENFDEGYEVLRRLKESPIPGMEDGLLIEEAVFGKEVSMFFACNGEEYSYLGSAQDHKRLLDADKGPNTGGMGAISPVLWVDKNFVQKITDHFLRPTLKAMAQSGSHFKGVLFLGLMVDGENVNLLEYNVRFGDPETQVILPLIEGDLAQFLLDFSESRQTSLSLKTSAAVHIVKAARGYPGIFGTSIEKGRPIIFESDEIKNSKVFFAGVKKKNNELLTDGGRVFGVTSWSETPTEARLLAYETLDLIHFEGEHYRRDIGVKS